MNAAMIARVARWEFLRYFSWKQELFGVVLLIALALLMGLGSAFVEAAKRSEHYTIAIWDSLGLELSAPEGSQFTFKRLDDPDLRWEREQVALQQLDGLLSVRALDDVELLVRKDPAWEDELRALLDRALRERRLAEAGVAPADYAAWSAPAPLRIVHHDGGRGPSSRAAETVALVFLGLLLTAVFVCFAYFFTSITSEKQARLTEQVLSAIDTQDWIDGKILGIGGHGIKAILTLLLWGALALYGAWLFIDDDAWLLGVLAAVSVDRVLIGLLFVLLGLGFWCAFLAGAAAIIDDPNNSNKSLLMFVPTIPPALVFPLLEHADNWAMVLLSWFPPTAMAAMPVRAMLGDVQWWEVLGSALLLALSIRLMRRSAGRVFRASMMLYGKEPGWRQIWRWMRGAAVDPAG